MGAILLCALGRRRDDEDCCERSEVISGLSRRLGEEAFGRMIGDFAFRSERSGVRVSSDLVELSS